MIHRLPSLRTLLTFLPLAVLACSAVQANVSAVVSWTPERIAAGSPCLFKVQTQTNASSVQGTWQGHSLSFFPSEDRHLWYALAGVDVEAKPGDYKVDIDATMPNGGVEHVEREIAVAAAPYKTEVLHVPQKFVKPSPQAMAQIEADRELKKSAFARQIPVAEWSGVFQAPVNTKPSEGFGTRRTFNGQLASIHKGMDYHAAPGTPVLAANSGEVILAAPLYYEGNCVIINHGQQFMTMYMHLSQLSVKPGDQVRRGQQVGLSGATGRATGPHFHVSVRWENAYLDPAQLWVLPLPAFSQAKDSSAAPR